MPDTPAMDRARVASAKVDAFIAAGPDFEDDWLVRRGDAAMDAAHALRELICELDWIASRAEADTAAGA